MLFQVPVARKLGVPQGRFLSVYTVTDPPGDAKLGRGVLGALTKSTQSSLRRRPRTDGEGSFHTDLGPELLAGAQVATHVQEGPRGAGLSPETACRSRGERLVWQVPGKAGGT